MLKNFVITCRAHLGNAVDIFCEWSIRPTEFVQWHYPLIAIAVLLINGIALLTMILQRPSVYLSQYGYVILAVMLSAAIWVASRASDYRAGLMRERAYMNG